MWEVEKLIPGVLTLFRSLCLPSPQEPTFKHDDALKQVDCIMTVVGVDEEILYSKSHALQVIIEPEQ